MKLRIAIWAAAGAPGSGFMDGLHLFDPPEHSRNSADSRVPDLSNRAC